MKNLMANRRQVVIGLAAASAVPTVGFAQSGTPTYGGTLKISHSTRIATLNVMQLSGPAEYPCVDMLYSGLTRIEPGRNSAGPDLATSWEANEDATQFTYNLRQGVTFHDGTPFTSADVVATFEAILDADFGSPARSVLDVIETVEAVDDHTVRFNLNAPYADLPISTAHANARIVSAAALSGDLADLETKPNGTGPFKLESYDSARITRLVRNDSYYKEGQPYLDAVEMHLFPDLAAETANYLSGNVDVMLNVQQADFARIAAAEGSNALRVPAGRYVNVVMRQDQPPFDDVRLRKALALSVDRQLLVDLVLEGLGRPAYDNILSPEFQYAIDTPRFPTIRLPQRPFSPKRDIRTESASRWWPRTARRSAGRLQSRSRRWPDRPASTLRSRQCRTTPTSRTSGARAISTWPTGGCSPPRMRPSTCS